LQCVRGVFVVDSDARRTTQKDAKTQFLAPWHPAVAATNNLMNVLYFSSEMSGLWPGPRSQKIR
jgi:hypothetical protein